jgi:NADH-quinone oxidoreductase subunit J
MTPVFIILSLITLASGMAAMALRNLVHCALSLALTFAGLAALYLQLNAEFVGFAQILVYVGAVAILIVFAILLTRGSEPPVERLYSRSWVAGLAVALIVFALIAAVILSRKAMPPPTPSAPIGTVRQLGDQLMSRYVLPLEVLGLLLTAALIGAVILALQEPPQKRSGGVQ